MMAWPHYAPSKTTIQYRGRPVGEVDIGRGERVRADDGAIGRVQGLVVLPRDEHEGTFAEGEETLAPDKHQGSFADGEETQRPDEHEGSFAEGEETLPPKP
jgi:hypothetical protein